MTIITIIYLTMSHPYNIPLFSKRHPVSQMLDSNEFMCLSAASCMSPSIITWTSYRTSSLNSMSGLVCSQHARVCVCLCVCTCVRVSMVCRESAMWLYNTTYHMIMICIQIISQSHHTITTSVYTCTCDWRQLHVLAQPMRKVFFFKLMSSFPTLIGQS